jgi:hypothetical protein
MIYNATATFLAPTEGDKTASGRPTITYAASETVPCWITNVSASPYRQGKEGVSYEFEMSCLVQAEVDSSWRVQVGSETYCIKSWKQAYAGVSAHHKYFGLSIVRG